MTSEKKNVEPLLFSAVVPLKPEAAFELFTTRMGRWWPLIDYSVSKVNAETCIVETFAGGRVFERSGTGEEFEWGRVLVMEKPHRLVMTWHPGGGPVTEVHVTFIASGTGTLVTLEHRKWEVFGEMAVEAREGYANGWPYVFAKRFVEAAQAENR